MSTKTLLSATSISVLLMATASHIAPAYADAGNVVYSGIYNSKTIDTA